MKLGLLSSAWLVLAGVALLGAAWVTRYDISTVADAGVLVVTLDRWTGSEEVCRGDESGGECAYIDRSRVTSGSTR